MTTEVIIAFSRVWVALQANPEEQLRIYINQKVVIEPKYCGLIISAYNNHAEYEDYYRSHRGGRAARPGEDHNRWSTCDAGLCQPDRRRWIFERCQPGCQRSKVADGLTEKPNEEFSIPDFSPKPEQIFTFGL